MMKSLAGKTDADGRKELDEWLAARAEIETDVRTASTLSLERLDSIALAKAGVTPRDVIVTRSDDPED